MKFHSFSLQANSESTIRGDAIAPNPLSSEILHLIYSISVLNELADTLNQTIGSIKEL